MSLQKLAQLYRNVALLLLNTLVLFVGLNGVIWIFELVTPGMFADPSPPPQIIISPVYNVGSLEYGFNRLRQVYPGIPDKDIVFLLLEVSNMKTIYDADTLYREQPLEGEYVTVDPAGFRWVKDQGPWPPNDDAYNIFVFGGSTTFALGESDEHTIPSFLQQHLRDTLYSDNIFVYNFGHLGFFSLQERLEFDALIRDGFVPDLAIFIDGLNDFAWWDDEPFPLPRYPDPLSTTERLRKTLTCRHDEWCWPAQRLAAHIGALTKPDSAASAKRAKPPPYDRASNIATLNRWLENKRAIEEVAAAHNVQTLFVLQPVPVYAYDLEYHLFLNEDNLPDLIERPRWAYPILEEMAAADTENWTANFLNLAHLGEDKQEPIYVDRTHYTSAFMNEIASAITAVLLPETWIYQVPKHVLPEVLPMERFEPTSFGDAVLLLGYDVYNHVGRDGKLRVNLYWQALRRMEEDCTIYLKLVNSVYHIWGQQDSRPVWDGSPTNMWEKGQVVGDMREIEILPGTPPGLYRVEVILVDLHSGRTLEPEGGESVLLGPIEVPRREPPSIDDLDIEKSMEMNLENKVQLLGYNIESGFRPGDKVHLTLFWRCLENMEQSYTVFTHLVDADDNLVAQKDNPPVDSFYPTTRWEVGEIVRDQYDLVVPPDVPPGEYRLNVGMYLAETGERLAISDDRNGQSDTRILLQEIQIESKVGNDEPE